MTNPKPPELQEATLEETREFFRKEETFVNPHALIIPHRFAKAIQTALDRPTEREMTGEVETILHAVRILPTNCKHDHDTKDFIIAELEKLSSNAAMSKADAGEPSYFHLCNGYPHNKETDWAIQYLTGEGEHTSFDPEKIRATNILIDFAKHIRGIETAAPDHELKPEDFAKFKNAIDNPPEPTPALVELLSDASPSVGKALEIERGSIVEAVGKVLRNCDSTDWAGRRFQMAEWVADSVIKVLGDKIDVQKR